MHNNDPLTTFSSVVQLESLLHPGANSLQVGVDLAWRRSKNERDDRVTRDLDVLDGTEDVDLAGSVSTQLWEKRLTCRQEQFVFGSRSQW